MLSATSIFEVEVEEIEKQTSVNVGSSIKMAGVSKVFYVHELCMLLQLVVELRAYDWLLRVSSSH